MGCLGMPVALFDLTRRGREDVNQQKKEALFFSTWGGGSRPVVGCGGVGLAGKGCNTVYNTFDPNMQPGESRISCVGHSRNAAVVEKCKMTVGSGEEVSISLGYALGLRTD
jgi:hypothetical protein